VCDIYIYIYRVKKRRKEGRREGGKEGKNSSEKKKNPSQWQAIQLKKARLSCIIDIEK
jgi:hypothetical protein